MATDTIWREPSPLHNHDKTRHAPTMHKREAISGDPARDSQGPHHAGARESFTAPATHTEEATLDTNTGVGPLIHIDASGTVMGWNRGAETLFGYAAREVTGTRLPTVPPEEDERFACFHARVIAGETITNIEVEYRHREGQTLPILLSAAPWRMDGAIVGSVLTLTDVSVYRAREHEHVRRVADEQRRARDAAYIAAVAEACGAATDGAAILQGLAELTATWADCAGVVAHGATGGELVAYASRTPESGGAMAALFAACASGFPGIAPEGMPHAAAPRVQSLREVPLTTTTVARGYHTLASVPMHADGEPVGVLYAAARSATPAMDATALATLERATAQAGARIAHIRTLQAVRERLAVLEAAARQKDEFLATVSHELRTPLTAILGFAHIIVENDSIGAAARRGMAEDIVASGGLLLTQVNDLLDIVQIGAGRLTVVPERVDVTTVVQWCERAVQALMGSKGLRFTVSSPANLPHIHANTARLEQVVLNLLVNAYKFTPAGGSITVETTTTGGMVAIAVRDTGIGIAPEHAARIFEPFERIETEYTCTQAGAGVGLAVARQLVQMMGGAIALESTVDVGSVFTVTFKAATDE